MTALTLLAFVAASPADPADAVYHGGPVVTACAGRATAEAVAVKGGRVVAVGAKADVMAHAGPFAVPLIENVIAQLECRCTAAERQRLCVLKKSLAWQRTIGAARL